MTDTDAGETSDEEILRAIDEHYAPAVGTSDISDAVGVSRQAVDQRLRRLVDEGYVDTHMAGKSRVWWVTSTGKRRISDA